MKPLGRQSMDIVEAAREKGGPSPEARARLRDKVLSRVGGAALAAAAATSVVEVAAGSSVGAAAAVTTGVSVGAAAGGAVTTGATAGGLGLLGKIGITALFVGVIGAGAYATTQSSKPESKTSPSPSLAMADAKLTTPGSTERPVTSDARPTTNDAAGGEVRTEAPEAEPPRVAMTSSTPATTAREVVPPAASSGADDLAGETALLGDAHRALGAGNAARALEILDEHAARYPKSALGPERRAGRALALCSIGRKDEGRLEADALSRSMPGSPLAARVEAACR